MPDPKDENPKSETQSPSANEEAKTVVEWAYHNLLTDESRPFPYTNPQFNFGPLAYGPKLVPIVVPIEKNDPTTTQIRFTLGETRDRILEFERTLLKASEQAKEIFARGELLESNPRDMANALGRAIGDFNKLLLSLAGSNAATEADAVKQLAFRAIAVAEGLKRLAKGKPDLVKSIARQWGAWPVAYSPHADSKRENEAMIEKLEVGHAAPENVWGKWSNAPTEYQPFREILGQYTARMMQTVLRSIHDMPYLRVRFQMEVRGPLGWIANTGTPFTDEERERLCAIGWPKWIVDAVCLPDFSNEAAPAWFEVGWTALKEAAGGKVASIEELKPVGHSREEYWKRNDFSEKIQSSQREALIHDRLRDAFLSRFKITP